MRYPEPVPIPAALRAAILPHAPPDPTVNPYPSSAEAMAAARLRARFTAGWTIGNPPERVTQPKGLVSVGPVGWYPALPERPVVKKKRAKKPPRAGRGMRPVFASMPTAVIGPVIGKPRLRDWLRWR